MQTRGMVVVLGLSLLVFMTGTVGGASCEAETCKPAVKSDPGVTLYLARAAEDAEGSLSFRVELMNTGKKPFSLSVCPNMLLCCVDGLHPMIAYGDSGQGLLDVCKEKSPSKHEVFLPVRASFAFDMHIPLNRLPAELQKGANEIAVHLCFDVPGGGQVHSQPLKMTVRL